MLLPKIEESTIENITTEFFRADNVFLYLSNKMNQLNEHNPNLMTAISDLSYQIFIEHDNTSNEEKAVNRARAISIALLVANAINTQMEIDWLKG